MAIGLNFYLIKLGCFFKNYPLSSAQHPKHVTILQRSINKTNPDKRSLYHTDGLVLCQMHAGIVIMLYQNKVKHTVAVTTSFFLLTAVAVAFSFSACSSNAVTEAEAQRKDSLMADSVEKAAATSDTLTSSKTTTVITTGTAMANPAKKNGRWEVIIERNRKWEEEYANMMLERDRQGIYYRTEVKPSYPGGEKALARFIQENIVYPEAALENGVEGEVMVGFAVDEQGVIYTPIIKGDLAGYGLDEAATNVVAKMPLWNPGQIKGRNVKSYFTLPIRFKIY